MPKKQTDNNSKAAALAKRQAKRRMEKEFALDIYVSREMLECGGWDTSKVDDDTMYALTNHIRKGLEETFDINISAACQDLAIPERPEEPAV